MPAGEKDDTEERNPFLTQKAYFSDRSTCLLTFQAWGTRAEPLMTGSDGGRRPSFFPLFKALPTQQLIECLCMPLHVSIFVPTNPLIFSFFQSKILLCVPRAGLLVSEIRMTVFRLEILKISLVSKLCCMFFWQILGCPKIKVTTNLKGE